MATANPSNGYFWMGNKTMKVPMALFAQNRKRLVEALRKEVGLPSNSIVLLQGGGDQGRCAGDSSDVGPVFRQESYFHWAFGVLEPDHYGAIDVNTGRSILFIPRLPEDYATVMGHIATTEEVRQSYQVDLVYYTDEIPLRWGEYASKDNEHFSCNNLQNFLSFKISNNCYSLNNCFIENDMNKTMLNIIYNNHC